MEIKKNELQAFNAEAKTAEILKELKLEVDTIDEEAWDLIKGDVGNFAKALADYQAEKIFNPKVTTELDGKYLKIVGLKSIKRIVQGRLEDRANRIVDKIKKALETTTLYALDFAFKAAKIWLGSPA